MGLTGLIIINATEPEAPAMLPLYKGVFRQEDFINENFEAVFKDRTNVTSTQDAPEIAKNALEPYGGLPPDAEFGLAETVYGNTYNSSTWKIEASDPIYTDVFYHRVVDGMPVLGFSDKIQVTLGEDGKVLEILKIWRTLEYTGHNVSIISARAATDKFLNGEVLDPLMGMNDIQIHTIKLGYYEKSRTEPEIFLEPVWVFQGNKTSGTPEEFHVYARQFANFTAAPTYGKVPLTVTFTDTSDASPVKWYWDFGDGTNSTDQNLLHTYKSAGTYNISLRAWNDLGSDMMEKAGYITVESSPPGTYEFTKDDNRKTVMVGKGSQINVTLKENPSTGYTWTFVSKGLTEKGSVYIPLPSSRLGAPGTRVVSYSADTPGIAIISGWYTRSWETPSPANPFAEPEPGIDLDTR